LPHTRSAGGAPETAPEPRLKRIGARRRSGTPIDVRLDPHSGSSATTRSDGRTITGGPTSPWTWEIAELFRIEKGTIRRIDAILVQSPYGQQSGWSSYEDSMSDRARDIR
jgi:hypothetical protein